MADLGRFHTHLIRTRTKQTRPRNTIYDMLSQLGPCSAQALVVALQGTVGRATVYRTIRRFLKLGIIDEISLGLFELTDRFVQHHHYFICRQCDKHIIFHDERLEKVLMRRA